MPKKHAPAYTTTKPSYVHPSLQSSRASSSSALAEPQTVNQRIAQLRREQAPRPTSEQRDTITSVVSSRTVPPDLRRILHIPEVNAPKPKTGRMRMRMADGRRPPPGPAAPQSWLHSSRHAPKYSRSLRDSSDAPARFGTLAKVTEADWKHIPHPRSLQHQCLKAFALRFQELVEYEQHYISSLPAALKEALLSYLALYAPRGSLDLHALKILFQDDYDGISGGDELKFLDLTELLNDDLTIGDLGKCLKRTQQVADVMLDLSIDDSQSRRRREKGKGKATAIAPVADSWEEEADHDAPVQPIPSVQLKIPHFAHLSRLSLAHPGAAASWPELLRISPNLNKITHLSLAYWPRPTLTPNAVTTSMVSQWGAQSLSGTPYYSDLDDDWHEAANILRRFSINTYSLEWLDLEGCAWLKALTFRPYPSSQGTPMSLTPPQHDSAPWPLEVLVPSGPDWNDSWQRVTYINFFQGWIPADNQSLQNMPAGVIAVQLMRWLREHRADEESMWKLNAMESGHAVAEWVDREKMARAVGKEIRAIRSGREGGYVKVDYGWGGMVEVQRAV